MQETRPNYIFFIIIATVLSTLVIYGGIRYRSLSKELIDTKNKFETIHASDEAKFNALIATTTILESQLASTTDKNIELSKHLGIVSEYNSSLSQRVESTQNQLNVLDKLRKTDKELLQKYSKVFFLNDNYVPSALATITPALVYDKQKTLLIHAEVKPFLERMMVDAASSSHPLSLISSYRSFKDQETLKSAYTMTFGSGANKFSADQGYSEHQLGTTVDFTTPSLGKNFPSFAGSEAYSWLAQNAYKYGFVLSYPKQNGYYVYEPWHWRFVGIVLSARLHQEGKNFYELTQRDIDEYLIDIFVLKETM